MTTAAPPREVPLGGRKAAGRVALVSPGKYELVMRHRWWVQEDTRPGHQSGPYARTDVPADNKRGRRHLFMHVLVAGYPKPDHIDGDGLNNQDDNLRPATPAQSCMNRGKRWRGSSRYTGVTATASGRWMARIGHEGRVRHLGTFGIEEVAARAYDTAARELFGAYARPNFPESETL